MHWRSFTERALTRGGLLESAVLAAALVALTALACVPTGGASGPDFVVTFSSAQSAEPLDGRIVLVLAQREDPEPHFQVSAGPRAPLIFGIDVEDWQPGTVATFDDTVFGFPTEKLSDVPPDGSPIRIIWTIIRPPAVGPHERHPQAFRAGGGAQ